MRRFRFWFWGKLFVHSHRSARLTKWLYARHRAAKP